MSTQGTRDYRPFLHYTPPKGWINDPNGLVWDGSAYHLFAQHYPYSANGGPPHWIHATSSDLIHWKHLGIPLAPDELGYIFSGCAVWDKENTSGLGAKGSPIVAVFTHHGEFQQQSIAWSDDGVNFTKYPGNPVIPSNLKNFRDSKVFPNSVLGGWTAVIAAGDEVRFFHSDDLIHWVKSGSFGKAENKLGGVFECPDLFALKAPDGKAVWVLTTSVTHPPEAGGCRSQYFLGTFDGHSFRQTILTGGTLLLESGHDNYAAVTFFGVSPALQIGWASNWSYAGDLPTGEYCGQMTLARSLSLAKTKAGLRLAALPVLPPLVNTQAVLTGGKLPSEVFVLDVTANGAFEAVLANAMDERFVFGLDASGVFYTNRERSGEAVINRYYNSPLYRRTAAQRLMTGPVIVRLVFDRSIAELFADGGTYVSTTLVFPSKPYDTVKLNRCSATVSELVY